MPLPASVEMRPRRDFAATPVPRAADLVPFGSSWVRRRQTCRGGGGEAARLVAADSPPYGDAGLGLAA